ncbi:hypothetical protein M0802_008926 [Mischocyttarus mexicanus]|nr:hypothetical protein M0802_008926 [Mischocyttarus mexicanus]
MIRFLVIFKNGHSNVDAYGGENLPSVNPLEIILIGVAIGTQYDDDITNTICNIFCIVSMLIVIHILCDIIVELCNLFDPNLKYYGIQQLKVSFKYKISIGICIVFLVAQTVNEKSWYIWRRHNIANLCFYCFVIILFKTPILSQRNVNLNISNMNGLDYGTGMAFSYYYGYLKIILPSTGTASKGFIEKLENLEDNHNISVSVKKLFILIPSSAYTSPDLKDFSNSWMESALQLEKEEKKPSVKPEYVAIEGASPLLTMFEVQKHSHPESATYTKYHKQIIKAFYLKLKDIIYNDLNCRDLCELIYYEDYNSDGTKVNVAKIILERISKLKNIE